MARSAALWHLAATKAHLEGELRLLAYLTLICISSAVMALPVKSQMLKPRAFFQETDNNLFEPLDLKLKTLYFTKSDFEQCGQNLVRQAQTLSFACTLQIPVKARISKLQRVTEATKRELMFGDSRRTVSIHVDDQARSLTLMTVFDSAGIDFELQRFNDDFFPVYAKVAQLVISEALAQPIRFEVLESRDVPVQAPRLLPSKKQKAPMAPPLPDSNNKKKVTKIDFTN